ncbi:MAG: hypothetical protein NVS3B25_30850 [Hymenobacter sp.]
MSKHSKKHRHKQAGKQQAPLLVVPQPPSTAGVWTRLSRFSTARKVVAGLTLVVLGVGYLARRRASLTPPAHPRPDAARAEHKLSALGANPLS